jgi:hypothetical protein
VGRAGEEAAGGKDLRRDVAADREILPFLREVLGDANRPRDDVVASALIAYARSTRDRPAIPYLLRSLDDRGEGRIVRESAVLSVGHLHRARESARLAASDLDLLRRRLLEVFDDEREPERVRGFAALSLGLLGDQPFGAAYGEDGSLLA